MSHKFGNLNRFKLLQRRSGRVKHGGPLWGLTWKGLCKYPAETRAGQYLSGGGSNQIRETGTRMKIIIGVSATRAVEMGIGV